METYTPRGQNGNFITTTIAPCTTASTYYSHLESFHHHATTVASAASAYHARLYGGGGSQKHLDPHLMCLKLGIRNYFEDATGRHVTGFSISKKGKTYYSGGGVSADLTVTVAFPASVPKCQAEGCHVALINAKEYHRRHKVCDVHSKAPKVVVHGLEQRFCQQCSRFHVVTEFDDTKRSCRRRLAGHNERRRKSSHEHSTTTLPRNDVSLQGRKSLGIVRSGHRSLGTLYLTRQRHNFEWKEGFDRFPYAQSHTRTLRNESWISSPDLSSRCSAALRELIAENCAALLGKQLVIDKEWPIQHAMEDLNVHQDNNLNNHEYLVSSNQKNIFSEQQGWDRFVEPGTNNVTLDLMQDPASAFELLSVRGKSKEEEERSQLRTSFGGTNVV